MERPFVDTRHWEIRRVWRGIFEGESGAESVVRSHKDHVVWYKPIGNTTLFSAHTCMLYYIHIIGMTYCAPSSDPGVVDDW